MGQQMKEQLNRVLDICKPFNVVPSKQQINKEIIRLTSTDDMALFSDKEVKTSISDHDITEVTTACNVDMNENNDTAMKDGTRLRDMNFYINEIRWNEINDLNANTSQNDVFKENNIIDDTIVLFKRLSHILRNLIPVKKKINQMPNKKTVDEEKRMGKRKDQQQEEREEKSLMKI